MVNFEIMSWFGITSVIFGWIFYVRLLVVICHAIIDSIEDRKKKKETKKFREKETLNRLLELEKFVEEFFI